ncbi:MAG: hypothetical protein ACR2N3_08420 [Pyrinomonadaceae bacterium]
MKKNLILILIFTIILALGFQTVSAQFNIKIPKLPKTEKPKTEQPKPDDNSTPQSQSNQNSSNQNRAAQTGGFDYPKRIEPTSNQMFLKDTLEIKIQKDDHYRKVPNQNDYTRWLPQVSFDVFFDNSAKVRYQAEWFNPDGSPWFNESLDAGAFSDDSQTIGVSSPYSGDLLNTKAVTTTGTYGVKITSSTTVSVDVPHCAEHQVGARLTGATSSPQIKFRSYPYLRAFCQLNGTIPG